MHPLTAPAISLFFPQYSHLHLTPSGSTTRGRRRKRRLLVQVQGFAALSLSPANDVGSVLGCGDSLRKGNCSGFLRRCKDWDNNSEGDFSSLEAEILEFMENSQNPKAFPTREQLVAAGRVDLAEAVLKKGGWLAFGWDLDERSREIGDFVDSRSSQIDGNATWASRVVSSSSANSSQPVGSVEIAAGESGIEGILNRLEKERSDSLGLGFREKDKSVSSKNNEDKDERDQTTTTDEVAAELKKSSRPSLLSPTSSPRNGFHIKLDQRRSQLGSDNFRNSLQPEMWRNWIIQRTGFSNSDFEDAEIAPRETQKGDVSNISGQPDILKIGEFSGESMNRGAGLGSHDGNANHSDIKSRIQHLESELSSVLHSLRSRADKITMQMEQKSSGDDLAELSDAWEFQENEIMNAQDKLRSIRAKLAVLEGKMALAIMDAQKIVEEKQKRINNAQRALRILKTACVVWPNAASEVFLAGSFDGWSSQRKMEKSRTGVFSVCLQLYPGKYEIKFIVDGEWRIDPLRPIVHSNGFQNNLLVIHDF